MNQKQWRRVMEARGCPGIPSKYGLVVLHSSLHLTISIHAFEMSFMISMLIAVEGERAKTVDIDRVVEYFWKSFDVQRRQ